MSGRARIREVLTTLDQEGLLLVTDACLPSVAGIVAGEPVEGSWWSHPRARDIYAVLERLEEHEGVLVVKLLAGKETLVHDGLWPELFSIATARQPWQTHGLSEPAREILDRVDSEASVRVDEISGDKRAVKKAARELEGRLLVHGANVHTETGAHQKVLSSWNECARTHGFKLRPRDPETSKRRLEDKVERWRTDYGKTASLPWQRRSPR